MNVFITGGAGFIGSHLAQFHLHQQDTVTVLDDLSTGSADNLPLFEPQSHLRFVRGNVMDWVGLPAAIQEADRIYHMAAIVGMFRVLKEPIDVLRVNIMGTERVLELAAQSGKNPQVVLPSSSSVYGATDYDQLHESAPVKMYPDAPLLNYAISKLTNEVQARAYHETHGLKVAVARLFNTVGARQCALYGFVLPRFVQQAMSGKPITVFGDGSQTRSFCDVRDTVNMLSLLAGCNEAYGTPVNIGNTQEITILRLAQLVKDLTKSTSTIEFVPYEQAYGQTFDQIPQRRPILDKMENLLGYKHEHSLEQSIMALCRHYQSVSPTNMVRGYIFQERRAKPRSFLPQIEQRPLESAA